MTTHNKGRIRFCAIIGIICILLSTVLLTASATGVTPELRIAFCTLSFRDSVCIEYAVDTNVENVTVLVWDAPQAEYVAGTQTYTLTDHYSEEISETLCEVYDFNKLVAKQMTNVVYARAYVQVGGVDYYSDVNKYSILQYAYNKLGKTATASADEHLKDMLNHMLSYGAAAQQYFSYNTTRLATADFYQVKVTDGLLADGCTHGLYLPGDKVVLKASATNAGGDAFSCWKDSLGNVVSNTAEFELTVGGKNEVYTPAYGIVAPEPSQGLEFLSNEDGTCYLAGIGTCTDTEIVVPAVSPEGDTVMGVDSKAFRNDTAITSISLPNTVTEIGSRAFDGCISLTDVYYDGTEDDWNLIDISGYNDPLNNAAKHFKTATYTVTFKDWNGTVLKTQENVVGGTAATAPADPTRDGYTFTGWDKAFDNVTGDLVVTAQYQLAVTGFTISASNEIAGAGETVSVKVDLHNNPGSLGLMIFNVHYDEQVLTLNNIAYSFAGSGQQPANTNSPVRLTWYTDRADVSNDGNFAILTFSVKSIASAGDYSDISFSYNANEITDINETPVVLNAMSGRVTIQ